MFSSGFKSFLEKPFKVGETRRIQATHNLNVVLYHQAPRLSIFDHERLQQRAYHGQFERGSLETHVPSRGIAQHETEINVD